MAITIPKVPVRLALPRALPTDLPSCLEYIKTLVEQLERQNNIIATYLNGAQGAGVLASRPLAGTQGRLFYATDVAHFYVDDGTAWQTLV